MTAAAAIRIDDQAASLYNPLDAGAYNPLPRIVARRQDITPGAKLVYAYLAGCFGRDGIVCPRVARIASETGMSERQAARCLAELRRVSLIESVRTGRSSAYQFAPLTAPRSDASVRADMTSTADRQAPTPLIENKRKKATAAVVAFPDTEGQQTALKSVRPDVQDNKALRRTIRQGIHSHGLDAVLKAIGYANHTSKTNYRAYLDKAIAQGWAEDWTPPQPPPSAQDVALVASQEAEQAAAMQVQKAELLKAREQAAAAYSQKTPTAQADIRERFLSQASAFDRRRCLRLKPEALVRTVSFINYLLTEVQP